MRRITLCLMMLILASIVYAEVPHLISYQGRITADNGVPLTGIQNFTFRFYNDSIGGNPIWTETQRIVIDSLGLYNVLLGSVITFPDSVNFSRQYYLAIVLESGIELQPRYPLTSSPYALNFSSMGALDGQVLKWNETLSKWEPTDAAGGGIGGAGLDNYLPRWNGTRSLESSLIYQTDDGKFGIGTTAPLGQLHLNRSTSTGLIITDTRQDGIEIDRASGSGIVINSVGNNGINIDAPAYNGIFIKDAERKGIVIQNSDSTGIYVTNTDYPNGSYGIYSRSDSRSDTVGYFGGNVHITGDLTVEGNYPSTDFYIADSSGTTRFIADRFNSQIRFDGAGGIGIGYNPTTHTIIIDGAGGIGNISAVYPGDGLSGGGTTGDIYLSVDSLWLSNWLSYQPISSSSHTHNLIGDLSGHTDNTTIVTGIMGRPISNIPPMVGQILKWNGTSWIPAADEIGHGVTSITLGSGLVGGGTGNVNIAIANGGIIWNHLSSAVRESIQTRANASQLYDGDTLTTRIGWRDISGIPTAIRDGNVNDADANPRNELITSFVWNDSTNNLSITEAETTWTVNINNEADDLSNNSIDNLYDVKTFGVIENGKVLKWDAVEGVWKPGSDSLWCGFPSTGTNNYIPRYHDYDSLRNSVIYQNNDGYIGINTTLPDVHLTVVGNAHVTGDLTVDGHINGVLTTENDGVIGNEIIDAADASLIRSGFGTTLDPFKLALNTYNPNIWYAPQTFNDIVVNNTITAAIANVYTINANTINTSNLIVSGMVFGDNASFDTLRSQSGNPADTVVMMSQLKVYGELIADSIQAVGAYIELDDTVNVHGDVNVDNDINVNGNAVINQTLHVQGNTVIDNNLTVGDNLTVFDTLKGNIGEFDTLSTNVLFVGEMNVDNFNAITITADTINVNIELANTVVTVNLISDTVTTNMLYSDTIYTIVINADTANIGYLNAGNINADTVNTHVLITDEFVLINDTLHAHIIVVDTLVGNTITTTYFYSDTATISSLTITDTLIITPGSFIGGDKANFDTLYTESGNTNDTMVVMSQLKIYGELIADSIQAVGDIIELDDSIHVHGSQTVDNNLYVNDNVTITDSLFVPYIFTTYLTATSLVSDSGVFNYLTVNDTLIANIALIDSLFANYAHFGNVDIDTLNVNIVNATVVNTDTLNVDYINANTIVTTTLTADTINTSYLNADTIRTINLIADTITTSMLFADTIHTTNLSADTIIVGSLSVTDTLILAPGAVISGDKANFDTLYTESGNTADTMVVMSQLKIYGELIADSIQAVGPMISLDDSITVHGNVKIDNNLQVGQNATINDNLVVTDTIFSSVMNTTNLNSSGLITANLVNGDSAIFNYLNLNNDLIVNGDVTINNNLTVVDTIFSDVSISNISISDTTVTEKLNVTNGSDTLTIYHSGDSTYINSTNPIVINGQIIENAPAFKIERISILNSPATDTWTKFKFDNVVLSETRGACYEWPVANDSTRIKIKKAGLYQFGGAVYVDNNSAYDVFNLNVISRIKKNSTEIRSSQAQYRKDLNMAQQIDLTFTGTVYCAVDDIIVLEYKTNDSNISFYGNSDFDNPVATSIWFTMLK